jgi:hypothetical protein
LAIVTAILPVVLKISRGTRLSRAVWTIAPIEAETLLLVAAADLLAHAIRQLWPPIRQHALVWEVKHECRVAA